MRNSRVLIEQMVGIGNCGIINPWPCAAHHRNFIQTLTSKIIPITPAYPSTRKPFSSTSDSDSDSSPEKKVTFQPMMASPCIYNGAFLSLDVSVGFIVIITVATFATDSTFFHKKIIFLFYLFSVTSSIPLVLLNHHYDEYVSTVKRIQGN